MRFVHEPYFRFPGTHVPRQTLLCLAVGAYVLFLGEGGVVQASSCTLSCGDILSQCLSVCSIAGSYAPTCPSDCEDSYTSCMDGCDFDSDPGGGSTPADDDDVVDTPADDDDNIDTPAPAVGEDSSSGCSVTAVRRCQKNVGLVCYDECFDCFSSGWSTSDPCGFDSSCDHNGESVACLSRFEILEGCYADCEAPMPTQVTPLSTAASSPNGSPAVRSSSNDGWMYPISRLALWCAAAALFFYE